MDRTEAAGLGVSVAGHVALLALLSAALVTASRAPIMPPAMEVSFVDEVALDAAAPQPSPQAAAPPPAAAPDIPRPEAVAAPTPTAPRPKTPAATPNPRRKVHQEEDGRSPCVETDLDEEEGGWATMFGSIPPLPAGTSSILSSSRCPPTTESDREAPT